VLVADDLDRGLLAAVDRQELPGPAGADGFLQRGDGPGIPLRDGVVAADHPDDVGQVLEARADEGAVGLQLTRAAGLDLPEEPFVAAAPSEVRRAEPGRDAALVGPADDFVGESEIRGIRSREITGPGERLDPRAISGWLGGELVFNQVDEDRVEAAPASALEVGLDVGLVQPRDGPPGRATAHP